MKKLLVLSAAALAFGLISCHAVAPEEPSSEPSTVSQPSTPSQDPVSNPSEVPSSDPSVTPSSEDKPYNWNVIDENTNLKLLAWDRYCETDSATDDASCENLGTAHVDALVAAYIATLPADTTVRVGVYHTTVYLNDPVAALANDYDIVLGAGAKISPNYGATNRKAINDMTADTNAYLATSTGRKVALMSETDEAIAAYYWLTGVQYEKPTEPTSEPSVAPSSDPSVEPSSEEPTSSKEPSPVTYDYNVINEQTNLVIGVWDAQSETKTDDVYSTSYTNAIVESFIGYLPVETEIRVGVKHYSESKVADFGAAINADLEANHYPDVLLGTGANIDTTGTVTSVIKKGALKDSFTLAKTGRQAALLNDKAGSIELYNYLVVTDSAYVVA